MLSVQALCDVTVSNVCNLAGQAGQQAEARWLPMKATVC